MTAEQRAQGRGWVRIPASRTERPASPGPAPHGPGPYGHGPYRPPAPAAPDRPTIYLSLLERWREAGRTLPGHPDEEWERLISQPCWPGR